MAPRAARAGGAGAGAWATFPAPGRTAWRESRARAGRLGAMWRRCASFTAWVAVTAGAAAVSMAAVSAVRDSEADDPVQALTSEEVERLLAQPLAEPEPIVTLGADPAPQQAPTRARAWPPPGFANPPRLTPPPAAVVGGSGARQVLRQPARPGAQAQPERAARPVKVTKGRQLSGAATGNAAAGSGGEPLRPLGVPHASSAPSATPAPSPSATPGSGESGTPRPHESPTPGPGESGTPTPAPIPPDPAAPPGSPTPSHLSSSRASGPSSPQLQRDPGSGAPRGGPTGTSVASSTKPEPGPTRQLPRSKVPGRATPVATPTSSMERQPEPLPAAEPTTRARPTPHSGPRAPRSRARNRAERAAAHASRPQREGPRVRQPGHGPGTSPGKR